MSITDSFSGTATKAKKEVIMAIAGGGIVRDRVTGFIGMN